MACYCAAAWGCGLVPAPADSPYTPTSTWRLSGSYSTGTGEAAWVATFPPYQREVGVGLGSSNAEVTKLFISPRKALTHSIQGAGPAHTPLEYLSPGSEPWRAGLDLPGHPARTPACGPEPRCGPMGTHLLIRPACSCWRSRGRQLVGAARVSAGNARFAAGRRRLSSRPPAWEAPGPDRWVSVTRCAALWALRIRSTVEI